MSQIPPGYFITGDEVKQEPAQVKIIKVNRPKEKVKKDLSAKLQEKTAR